MEWLAQPETWIAFITLVVLELVLGVDNVIFISILAGKLPVAEQQRARTTGILAAVITRPNGVEVRVLDDPSLGSLAVLLAGPPDGAREKERSR